jgi:hypothetical protein
MSKDYSAVHYNEVFQKSSHNSYNKGEGIYDQLLYWRIRSIEYDIHQGKTGRDTLTHDWYVYHMDVVSSWTSVDKLSDGLDVLAGFHKLNPQHEVVTLLLCGKDTWQTNQMPDDLDNLLRTKLTIDGHSALYTPSMLLRGSRSLTDSIRYLGWPLLSELRGKFIVLLTGSDLSTQDTVLSGYVGTNGANASSRVAFICPKTTATSQIGATTYSIFYNLPQDNMSLGSDVQAAGYVSRVYGSTAGIDDESLWNQAIGENIHLLATDQVNSDKDSWSTTANSKGFPFKGMGFSISPEPAEAGRINGLQVTSGDIWGNHDSFAFYFNKLADTALNRTYAMWVSSPGSEVDDYAKCGIMARASQDDDAIYFGVFRTGENRIRIQWRTTKGGSTQTLDAPMPDDAVDQEDLIFIKLEVYNNGYAARAWASVNLISGWVLIGSQTFSDELDNHGIAMSSHGDTDLRFLFGNADGSAIADGQLALIGGAAKAKFFVGVSPG